MMSFIAVHAEDTRVPFAVELTLIFMKPYRAWCARGIDFLEVRKMHPQNHERYFSPWRMTSEFFMEHI